MTTEIPQTRPILEAVSRPDPEVVERPKRHRFTAAYRASIVRLHEEGRARRAAAARGLYSSSLTEWRRQRDRGTLDVDNKRGRKPTPATESELVRLRKENAKLTKELAATRMVVDVQMLGPQKWTYYYLYVILDVFSRYVVGCMVAHGESAVLAEKLIAETLAKQGITRGQLTLHADRESSMKSKPVAFLLADLGVTKTHSRPHVSNDNPFSESQFKTMKYRPDFPDGSGCIEDARAFCHPFFGWYNDEHDHAGLGLHTPASVHYGQAAAIRGQRVEVLASAYAAHPERFVRIVPQPPLLPTAVWINPPSVEVQKISN